MDSPFRSPTRAFFVRFPSIPPRIHPFQRGASRGCSARTSAACSTMRTTNGRCARSAQCDRFPSFSLSLSLFFSSPFSLRFASPDTLSLSFPRSLWKFNFYPPFFLSLSLSRGSPIFSTYVHELAGTRYR